MRRLLVRGSLFLVILVALDQLFFAFQYHNDNIFKVITDEKLERAAEEFASTDPAADVLILGSSHAQFGLDPELLRDQLGRRAFNLAYGGGTRIGNQLLLLEAYVEARGAPELVLYPLDVISLNYKPYKRLGNIRPLIGERGQPQGNWLVARSRRLAIWADELPPLSAALRFGGNIPRYLGDLREGEWTIPYFRSDGATANLEMFSEYRGYEVSEHGFVRGLGRLDRDFVRYGDVDFRPRVAAAEALADIVSLCRERGIRLVLIQLPEHAVALAYRDKYAAFAAWMADFVAEQQVAYLDLNAEGAFPVDDDDLFFDSDHVNAAGAVVASRLVAERVRELVTTAPLENDDDEPEEAEDGKKPRWDAG